MLSWCPGAVPIMNIPCGPLAKQNCDLQSDIKQEFSNRNVFLDIPYSNYEDCEAALKEVLIEFDLNPIIAKNKLTSNAVLCKVCKLVKTCKFGITDISSASNSVSYEYGLMHGQGMKVCLLLRSASEKFTDIEGLEHIQYNDLRSFRIVVSRWILENVEEVEHSRVEDFIQNEERSLKENGEIQLLELKAVLLPEIIGEAYLTKESWRINDAEIKTDIAQALEKFNLGEIKDAVIAIRLAFDKAFRLWKKRYQAKVGGFGLGNQYIEELIRNNVLDINLAEYNKFIGFLPHVTWFESGTNQITLKRSYNSKSDKEALEFCLKFLFDTVSTFKRQVDI